MKEMKDAVGNELKAGDLVALSLERPLIFGRVLEVQEGGDAIDAAPAVRACGLHDHAPATSTATHADAGR